MSSTKRRSANYKPSIWSHEFVNSLDSIYAEKRYFEQAEELKEEVRKLLEKTNVLVDAIELVYALQRLGISYHFTNHINKILKNVECFFINGQNDCDGEYCRGSITENLHATALGFLLLRQSGYKIDPAEVFKSFLDDGGELKAEHCDNVKGLLGLYEASYLSMEGEEIMESVRVSATRRLKHKLEHRNDVDSNLIRQIKHAMEFPYHWSMQRLDARWFIDVYEKQEGTYPLLLQLAKLDFNIVQNMYQEELKELLSWYAGTGLTESMKFARDRLVESFLWAVGFVYEPHFQYCRMLLTKCIILITIIDDVYDVYGSLEELEIFTDVLERWDVNELDRLPEYMKTYFLVLFNTVNEMGHVRLKEQGFNVIPYASKTWVDLCKTYLIEAKWYYSGYKPSLEEYLINGWCSIGYPLTCITAYLCITNPLEQQPLEDLMTCPGYIKDQGVICRLLDDLGNSTDELERGDVPKSIQCYMHDTGVCEEDSRAYIKGLIGSTWKKVNKEFLVHGEYSRDFVNISLNMLRTVHRMYHYGDGHGIPGNESKGSVISMLVQPISLP